MEANFTGNKCKPSAPRRCTENLSRGRQFESAAEDHCHQLGYQVLARNYRIGRLEADLIALDADVLVLVEVRGRGSRQFRPALTLSRTKIRRLESLATMLQRKWKRRVRIELFEVLPREQGLPGEYGIKIYVVRGPATVHGGS